MALSRRSTLAATAAALTVPASAEEADLWSGNYWAVKWRDNRKIWLAMYRRRIGAPQPGETPRSVLFLVHGSSSGARSSFDLSVPGHGEYSTMNVFARSGFDVWTMDHEGYGQSSRTDGNSDIASGVEDLKAGVDVVAHETGLTRCTFMGESSGAIRAGAFAMVAPDRVDRLMLAAFTYTGKGSPTLTKRAEGLEYFRSHNRRPRDRAMIESIFTRDRPGTTDPAVPAAVADAELVYGDTVPTGTYLDMTSKLPLVDPTNVTCPVCILRGEYDGIATNEDLWDFFRQLPNGNRQFVIIAGAAHALGTSKSRLAFWHAMQSFLTMPAPPTA
jgi:pimeloyl-ACP methyl ester carboxylesterase